MILKDSGVIALYLAIIPASEVMNPLSKDSNINLCKLMNIY